MHAWKVGALPVEAYNVETLDARPDRSLICWHRQLKQCSRYKLSAHQREHSAYSKIVSFTSFERDESPL